MTGDGLQQKPENKKTISQSFLFPKGISVKSGPCGAGKQEDYVVANTSTAATLRPAIVRR
ncbi:hypothetical protein RAD15_02755 [Bradyrhizobium sp. 14AA]